MSGETTKARARERTELTLPEAIAMKGLEWQLRARIARLRSRLVDLGDGRRMEREVNRSRASLAAKLRQAERRLLELKQRSLF